jgi:hypothetical protein
MDRVLFNSSEPFGTLSHASTLLCVAYAIGLAIWHFMNDLRTSIRGLLRFGTRLHRVLNDASRPSSLWLCAI